MRAVRWGAASTEAAFVVPAGSLIEITNAEPRFAEAIVAALNQRGFKASLVNEPTGKGAATILTDGLTVDAAAKRHWSALQSARLARREGGAILILQPADQWSGLEGLSRTLRKEWPGIATYAWTVPSGTPGVVADGLERGLGDGILSNSAQLIAPSPGEPLGSSARLPQSTASVWLVTGGARGVTAACAISLAKAAGGTILLAGRSVEAPWPEDVPSTDDIRALRTGLVERARRAGARVTPSDIDRTARSLLAGAEIRATLQAIRESGASAVYLPMDAGDAASVSAVLADAQVTYGPITGLVHGAGVLADRLAAEKTEAELQRVFSPKVDGLENILRVLPAGQLAHIGLFSSAAAFFGNKGQSDYAMANAFLASAGRALAKANPASRVKVFHWGPWAGGMVDGALASHFEAQGIPLIPIDEGARIFVNELLGGDSAHVELVVGEAWATA